MTFFSSVEAVEGRAGEDGPETAPQAATTTTATRLMPRFSRHGKRLLLGRL